MIVYREVGKTQRKRLSFTQTKGEWTMDKFMESHGIELVEWGLPERYVLAE